MHFVSFLYPLKPQNHRKTSLQTKIQIIKPISPDYGNIKKADNWDAPRQSVTTQNVSATQCPCRLLPLLCSVSEQLTRLRNRHRKGVTSSPAAAYSLLHSEVSKEEDLLDYIILPFTGFLSLWPLTPCRTQGTALTKHEKEERKLSWRGEEDLVVSRVWWSQSTILALRK